MKTSVVSAAAIAFGLTLSACNSISYTPYTFEQLRAADYTLPSDVRKVVVSSCAQINVADSTYYNTSPSYNAERMQYANYMPAFVSAVLADKLNQSSYLQAEIDAQYHTYDSLLSNAATICNTHNADAMLIVTNCNYSGYVAMPNEEDVVMISAMQTNLQFVTPQGQTRSFETQHDTLTWLLNEENKFPPYKEIYYSIAEQTGIHIAIQIVPSWETRKRAIIGTSTRALADATNWTLANEWDKAKDIWASVAQNGTSTDKVCATIDLGLYYERIDDVHEAAMWFSKALDLIEQESKNVTVQSLKPSVEMLFRRSVDRQYEKILLDKQMSN